MSATVEEVKQLREIIRKLKSENLKTEKKPITFSITDKKQVAIHFDNFVCKLYKSQWLKIINNQEELIKFIK